MHLSSSCSSLVTFLTLLLASIPLACNYNGRTVAERQFAARVQSTLGISLPCTLAWCSPYLDGGSFGGVLVGAKGDSLPWAYGHGMIPPPATPSSIRHDRARVDAWEDSIVQSAPRLAYVGAKHYRESGAMPLAIGSPAESLFIRVLWKAADGDTVGTPLPGEQPSPGRQAKRLIAANIARSLERQRAGLEGIPPYRASR